MLDGMTNIKASEVLKEIKYYTEDLPPYSPDEVAEALEMAIKALDQRWIPVSERLPEFTADYKVTVGINYDGGGMFPEVRIALYNKVYKCWVVHESDRAIVGDVIAWMPLPDPYEEDEEDDGCKRSNN